MTQGQTEHGLNKKTSHNNPCKKLAFRFTNQWLNQALRLALSRFIQCWQTVLCFDPVLLRERFIDKRQNLIANERLKMENQFRLQISLEK